MCYERSWLWYASGEGDALCMFGFAYRDSTFEGCLKSLECLVGSRGRRRFVNGDVTFPCREAQKPDCAQDAVIKLNPLIQTRLHDKRLAFMLIWNDLYDRAVLIPKAFQLRFSLRRCS